VNEPGAPDGNEQGSRDKLHIVGNLALDDVVREDGTTRMAQPGGAALYVALGAGLWGIPVGIVSIVGSDYPEELLRNLSDRQIDLSRVNRLDRPGLRTWLLYEGGLRRVVHRLAAASHDEMSPRVEGLVDGLRGRAVHLAPMPFDIQRQWVSALSKVEGLEVTLDPYELLSSGDLETWRQQLKGIDGLLLSEDELRPPLNREDPLRIATALGFSSEDPAENSRFLLFKQGDRGGLAIRSGRAEPMRWRARASQIVDPTGAGDAFAGGLLAGRILGEDLSTALNRGVVSASFALEGEGADALLAAAPSDADTRLEEWFPE